MCFFFQAEDGIRDWSVTGVQTCALPISVGGEQVDPAADIAAYLLKGGPKEFPKQPVGGPSLGLVYDKNFTEKTADALRSEERRVGKEGRDEEGAGSIKEREGT